MSKIKIVYAGAVRLTQAMARAAVLVAGLAVILLALAGCATGAKDVQNWDNGRLVSEVIRHNQLWLAVNYGDDGSVISVALDTGGGADGMVESSFRANLDGNRLVSYAVESGNYRHRASPGQPGGEAALRGSVEPSAASDPRLPPGDGPLLPNSLRQYGGRAGDWEVRDFLSIRTPSLVSYSLGRLVWWGDPASLDRIKTMEVRYLEDGMMITAINWQDGFRSAYLPRNLARAVETTEVNLPNLSGEAQRYYSAVRVELLLTGASGEVERIAINLSGQGAAEW